MNFIIYAVMGMTFEPGSHQITQTIILTGGETVYAEGAELLPTGNFNVFRVIGDNVTIKGGKITGGKHCVQATDADGLTIDGLECHQCAGGMFIDNSYKPIVQNARMEGCEFGIYVTNAINPTIRGNTLHKNYRGNIVVGYTTGGKVIGNMVYADRDASLIGKSGDGVTVGAETNGVSITDNTIIDASCYGIWATPGSHRNTFERNTIVNPKTVALYDTSAGYNLFSDNRVISSPTSKSYYIVPDTTIVYRGEYWDLGGASYSAGLVY